ncbi:hypothetical protein H5410_046148 [Solanum commersonii]|uniref:Uncharacterized protein n=1 Tax=Solanum commersonii TaxID=4109 RepID=A0A9J5XDC3_SOLCO|nr:hypothetical protein H5410_046148 [Solanum commersonii]
MVMINQFKDIKEKYLIMLDQAIMENTISCKSKLLKEGYYFSIQATNEMVWPYQVMLSCKHFKMLVQANLKKDQAIMESTLSCKSKLLKKGYYFSIQATNEMVWPYQVMLSCKHFKMLVQANLKKGTISQSKAIHDIYYSS